MKLITTKVFKETLFAYVRGKRRILSEGGTYSSKTYSILQVLMLIAQETPEPLLISIVSESLPHLKKGAMKDFFAILGESMESNPYFNKSDSVYRRPEWKGSFEFFGADNEGKGRGPRRDILFINEANNVPWGIAEQLDQRTERCVFLDWNPVGEFWVHNYLSGELVVPGWLSDPGSAYIHSTYQDARDVISKAKIEDIESRKDKDPNWWNIYGLGRMGKIEGLVHPYFEQCDSLPDGEVGYGLDFGYSGSSSVLVANVVVDDALYSQELIYETGLTNDVLGRKMDLLGLLKKRGIIYADSAEPKSIQELYDKHFNISPCVKGRGSVAFGIQKVNQYRQFWTRDSLNCIRDQRNYRYIKKRESSGREYLSDETTHEWSDSMDARRYFVGSHSFARHVPARQSILGREVLVGSTLRQTRGQETQTILGGAFSGRRTILA